MKGGENINDSFLSRKHIIEGTLNSLKRLQLDYVDIISAHRYDKDAPVEEVCRAFNWLIENGKAFYWGTSEFRAQELLEINECCERLRLIKPMTDQSEYNILVRNRFETEMPPLFDKYGLGTSIWSPLAGGFLSGKYNEGKFPDGTRYGVLTNIPESKVEMFSAIIDYNKYKYLGTDRESTFSKFRELGKLAEELGCSQSQLAVAWVLKNTDVSVCILGASKPEYLKDNIKAMEIYSKWNPEIESKIEVN